MSRNVVDQQTTCVILGFLIVRMANSMEEDPPIDDAPDTQKGSLAEHVISSSDPGRKRSVTLIDKPTFQDQVIRLSESKEWSEAQKV